MDTADVEVDDRLAVVTINRPEVRNALSRHRLADLRAAGRSRRSTPPAAPRSATRRAPSS
jgi:enoyl-CoA hydratase/carnithine racemase